MRLLLLLLLLAGCSKAPAPVAKPDVPYVPPQTHIEHQAVQGGEVLVMDIANKTPTMGMDSIQRCYVWRDEQFKTATMHCGIDSTYLGPPTP